MTLEAAILCLALNIYHEARGEPMIGQLAVAMVTLNRAKRNFRRVCEIVFKPHQFSWTNKASVITEPKAFKLAQAIARNAFQLTDFTAGAIYYHRAGVYPHWATTKIRVGRWGNHIFYQEI